MTAKASSKKQITAEELAQLATSSEHRAMCVGYALNWPDSDLGVRDCLPQACECLREMAERITAILAKYGRTSLDNAVDEIGNVHPYWRDIKAYLDTFGEVPTSVPSHKSPVQNYLTYLMVRAAIRRAAAPVFQKRKEERDRANQERMERERVSRERLEAQQRESQRKAREAARAKEKAAREAEASRRGTCGVTFAGSSARFIEGGSSVFLYRQDVRRVEAVDQMLIVTDSHGREFRPRLTGPASVAFAEFTDWRWRASEEWERSTSKRRAAPVEDEDDNDDFGLGIIPR